MLWRLQRLIDGQAFSPTWKGVFFNPFYLARKGLCDEIAKIAPSLQGRLLDVGCGSKPYRHLFSVSEYVGLEIAGRAKDADCYYDGKTFPFADSIFDAVFSSQVLEHVFEPDNFIAEVNRVLVTGGMFLLAVPFVWDEHEQPYDYARYSSFGLRYLLEKHGFAVVEQRKSTGGIRVICQMINACIYKRTMKPERVFGLLLTLLLTAPFNLVAVFAGRTLPNKGSNLYLDNIVLARKTGCQEKATEVR